MRSRSDRCGSRRVVTLLDRLLRHESSTVTRKFESVVEIAGDTATATADVIYFRLTSDGRHQLLSGGYAFEFVRRDGAWKIRKLDFASFVLASPVFAENTGL
ncbi:MULTISPECIES: nuclear transport factor 2 family protein [unclassified Nocardia]|uniref:nuclear transport factor 2 family protein n=1 Tax=unclassified Nocardia TaxID=2637762 RepID=UPI0033BC3004